MQWSDRLSVEELAPQTVSRPALALSRGLLGVSEAVADIAGAKQSGGAPHIGLGLGPASQTDNGRRPWAWNVVGFYTLWVGELGCQYGYRAIGGRSAASRHRRLGKAS